MIHIKPLNKTNEVDWNEFVKLNVDKEYALTLKWKTILEQTFGYKNTYLLIYDQESVIGIFASYFIPSILLKNRLISIPFSDMGGFYFKKNTIDKQKTIAIQEILSNLNKQFGKTIPLEIRGSQDIQEDIFNKYFTTIKAYCKFVINLNQPLKDIEGKFSRNITRNLKKENTNFEIKVCTKKKELQEIYAIYLLEIKRLGSFPLPYLFLSSLWDNFYPTKNFIIFTLHYKNQLIGALSAITFKQTFYADLIMTHPKYQYLHPKVHLYKASIDYAWNNKYYYYDFNRTRKDSGVFKHKKKWGGIEESIRYYYNIDNINKNCFIDPSQKKYTLLTKLIPYIPLVLLKPLGNHFRKIAGK